jgi:iron complex transport system ATP-binding protein
VNINGQPLEQLSARARARCVAYLPQGRTCHADLTVEQVVALGRYPYQGAFGESTAANQEAIEEALIALDLQSFRERRITQLSGGEVARALFARALATKPKLLVADEPMAGLDPRFQLEAMRTLEGVAANGCAVLVTLHDLTLASRFCGRVVVLDQGQVVADGPPDDVLPEAVSRVFRVRPVRFEYEGRKVTVPWAVEVAR